MMIIVVLIMMSMICKCYDDVYNVFDIEHSPNHVNNGANNKIVITMVPKPDIEIY